MFYKSLEVKMGIHYNYASTKSAKLMEKQAKREKKLAEKKAKRQAKQGFSKITNILLLFISVIVQGISLLLYLILAFNFFFVGSIPEIQWVWEAVIFF
mgnify:CR=1 FL=1